MRTIAILNQKGGVGKTTTTVNVAAALAAAGRRVVVVDLDPQAHLTIHLGVEPQTIQTGAYDVLTQAADFLASLMLVRPNLWMLAANIDLVGAETELVNVVGREIILREAMQNSQEQFDFCLIDCPPALNVLSINALAAAEEVLIPLQPHFLALQGFGKLLQTVDIVNRRINPRLKVAGVLLCMNDTRASLSNEVRADIDRFLQSARGANNAWSEAEILPTFIRRNIKLAEAPSYGQTIFEYDPTCNGAEDYGKVARFLLGTEEMPAPAPVAAHEPPTDNPMPALGATSETPSDNLVPAPAAASEIPGTDPAPASAAPETPFAGPAPAGAAEPPSDDDTPAPGARPESAGDGPTAAPTAATPEPAADELAPAPPTALPIPIITVNLPVPRCYNPVPIWPESPAGSAPPARPNESPV